jgi:hypothetical protein
MTEERYWIVKQEDFEKRYSICKSCDSYNKEHDLCLLCHCEMKSKTTSIYSECPDGKWGRLDGNL